MDAFFEALSDIERRRILVDLLVPSPQTDGGTLAVGAVEQQTTESHVALYHTHLPKLADCGFIRWDRDSNEVTKGPRFEDVRPLLEAIDDQAEELPVNWI
ncbi:transcriptional regulator [Natrialbaceae archaeon A-CW1-1]